MKIRVGCLAALLAAAGAAQAQSPAVQAPVPMPPGMRVPVVPAQSGQVQTQQGQGQQGQGQQGQGQQGPAPAGQGSWETRGTATLQALDKIDDHVADLTVAVGQSVAFGHLSIAVRACVVRPADQPADAAALLDITDPRPGSPGFHGWMFVNEPAVSMLQHPTYDVRVTGCR